MTTIENGRTTLDNLDEAPSEGVTPSHPEGVLDRGVTMQAPPLPSGALAPDSPVEPTQGFPGRARRSELKAQRKVELAEAKRHAKADQKARRAAAAGQRRAGRHAAKLARIEQKKAERVALADRFPGVTQPIPVHRSWWFLAGAVAATAIVAVGMWRATDRGDVNFYAEMAAPEAETSGDTTTTFQLANPLGAVPFPLSPRAARLIGAGTPAVAVTLADGSRVSLGYTSLRAVADQMGAGPKDPCAAQLEVTSDSAQPLGLKVTSGKADAVPLFDCAKPTPAAGS